MICHHDQVREVMLNTDYAQPRTARICERCHSLVQPSLVGHPANRPQPVLPTVADVDDAPEIIDYHAARPTTPAERAARGRAIYRAHAPARHDRDLTRLRAIVGTADRVSTTDVVGAYNVQYAPQRISRHRTYDLLRELGFAPPPNRGDWVRLPEQERAA